MIVLEDRESVANDDTIGARKRLLIQTYAALLPGFAGPAFWQALTAPDVPLEVLVRCVRLAQARQDLQSRNRLLEIIVLRTQTYNEIWVRHVLARLNLLSGYECKALADDLYADLCERLLRALLDPRRRFWEENFLHCLMFERKHAYSAFMAREGYGKLQAVKALRQRLAQPDETRAMLCAIEARELFALVLTLPDDLKSVILLLFWEGRTEKETSHILGVTDRTIRNRLRRAIQRLRVVMEREEKDYV